MRSKNENVSIMLRAYDAGKAEAQIDCEKCEANHWDAIRKAEEKGRTDAIKELDAFWEAFSETEWLCDELNGEFIDEETGEEWCDKHCGKVSSYECIKQWCLLKDIKG